MAWIRERQVNQVIVETDSKVIYEALQSTEEDNSQYGQQHQDCRMLMRETHTTIAHVNRKANGVADALAKTWNFLYNWNEVPEVIKRLAVNDVIDSSFQ